MEHKSMEFTKSLFDFSLSQTTERVLKQKKILNNI